jgi:hypothetical protein
MLGGEALPGSVERFPLAELAHDVVQKERSRAAQSGVELVFDAPRGATLVDGNVGLLERALANLVDNALRHTPPGGRVQVSLAASGPGRVELNICDSGEGIAPEHQRRIFERFYQVPGRRSGHGGAGLGLAITQRIVTLHGGTLSVQSEPGRGACFRLSLPAAAGHRDASVRGRDEGVPSPA